MIKKWIENLALITQSALRETKLLFADSAVVFSYFLAIILVCFAYSYVYDKEVFSELPIAVVDQDKTTMSLELTRMIDATQELEVAYKGPSYEIAQELYVQRKVKGIVFIPNDFARDIQSNRPTSVSIFADGSYMLYYKNTLAAAMTSIQAFNANIQLIAQTSMGIPLKQAQASGQAFQVTATPLYNIDVGYGTFLMPEVFIIALQTLQLIGMGILGGTLREKKIYKSTFLSTPRKFSSVFVILGRGLCYLFFSMIILFVNIIVVTHIFNFPQRASLIDLFIFLIPVVLAITFFGMCFVGLFRRREDAIMTITIFSIPTLMLCGVSWPTDAFPLWAKIVGFFVPSTVGSQGFVYLSQFGAPLTMIKDVYWQMWGIALFYFIIAVIVHEKLINKKDQQ